MSRTMQLTVVVRPFYQPDFQAAFPRLARHLGHLQPDLAARNPSLYELAGRLDHLLYIFDGTPLRTVLLPQRAKILALHKEIEGQIASWRLAQADALLYQLEDIFDDIEQQLP
ncbi:MAG: hypothetical protein ACUVRZ_09760 [Desulfobacca sp.]|uniref:hypothetical protein n=1 Tax=Desulfobacca sp. TaxID=2067990 RepID=UPI00404A1794